MGSKVMTKAVFAGRRKWAVEQSDCLEFLRRLEEGSVDLILFSPPYEAQRSYSIGFDLRGQDWVDWMVKVFRACRRACKGLVACVCEGPTNDFRWSATPALLLADLHRAGFNLRKPAAFVRRGIPGSGGTDWWANGWEFVVCTTRPGKLPWSRNTDIGKPPAYPPGGIPTHRTKDGKRVHLVRQTAGYKNGDAVTRAVFYTPPDKANPGNVIRVPSGGGHAGSDLAHVNEAPYPLALVEPFVRCFCPPDGIVCDVFSGSGTTGHAALKWGRRFVGCDIRESQVALAERRLRGAEKSIGFLAEVGK